MGARFHTSLVILIIFGRAKICIEIAVRGHEHVCNYMYMVHGTWYMVQEHVHVNADVRVHAQVHYNNMYMRMHM